METFQEAWGTQTSQWFVTDAGHIRGIQIKHSKTNGEMSNNEKPQPLPQCKQIPLAKEQHVLTSLRPFVCSRFFTLQLCWVFFHLTSALPAGDELLYALDLWDIYLPNTETQQSQRPRKRENLWENVLQCLQGHSAISSLVNICHHGSFPWMDQLQCSCS